MDVILSISDLDTLVMVAILSAYAHSYAFCGCIFCTVALWLVEHCHNKYTAQHVTNVVYNAAYKHDTLSTLCMACWVFVCRCLSCIVLASFCSSPNP